MTGGRTQRIALVRQRFSSDGGAERFTAALAAALGRSGFEVTLVARSWPAAPQEGLRVLVCDPPFRTRRGRDAGFARAARALLERERFDLVQSHDRGVVGDVYRAGDGLHRSWLAERRRARGPLAAGASALSPWHRWTLAAEDRLFRSTELRAVICNSEMVRGEIAEAYDLPPARLHVVENFVDLDRFHPDRRSGRARIRSELRIGEDALLVALVGSGFERKGLRALLEAMARLPDRVQLLVVGEDRRRRAWEALAATLGLRDRTRFLGRRDDVEEVLGAADLFCLPALYDPGPNSVLEALASGLPVVTSSRCGLGDLVTRGGAGEVVDSLDVEALATALRSLAERPEELESRGRAARRIAEPLTERAHRSRLVALYRSLVPDADGPTS